jgi:hypothetical protein
VSNGFRWLLVALCLVAALFVLVDQAWPARCVTA